MDFEVAETFRDSNVWKGGREEIDVKTENKKLELRKIFIYFAISQPRSG